MLFTHLTLLCLLAQHPFNFLNTIPPSPGQEASVLDDEEEEDLDIIVIPDDKIDDDLCTG